MGFPALILINNSLCNTKEVMLKKIYSFLVDFTICQVINPPEKYILNKILFLFYLIFMKMNVVSPISLPRLRKLDDLYIQRFVQCQQLSKSTLRTFTHHLFSTFSTYSKDEIHEDIAKIYSSILKTFHLIKPKALLKRRILLGLLNAVTGFFD